VGELEGDRLEIKVIDAAQPLIDGHLGSGNAACVDQCSSSSRIHANDHPKHQVRLGM
jgi:hypothetical protein